MQDLTAMYQEMPDEKKDLIKTILGVPNDHNITEIIFDRESSTILRIKVVGPDQIEELRDADWSLIKDELLKFNR